MVNSDDRFLGTFTGRIVATDGIGIEGAVVVLPNDQPQLPLAEAVSDSHGRFNMNVARFEQVVIHRICHSLKIQANGFAPTYVDQRRLSLFEKGVTNLGEIVMDRGRTYSGRVVNELGKPIVGAIVMYNVIRFNPGSTFIPIGNDIEVATDGNGRFKASHMGVGIPSIGCYIPGYQYAYYSESQLANAEDDGQLPDLVLRAEFPIHGVVTNEAGEPMPGVIVSESNRESMTDSNGNFTLHGLGPNSSFQCQILHPGYARASKFVDVRDKDLEVLDQVEFSRIADNTDDPEAVPELRRAAKRTMACLEMVLKREANIQGLVVDAETGQPVEYSRIVLCGFTRDAEGSVSLDGCQIANAKQVRPGQFLLTYTTPREYHLTVIAEGYEDGEAFTPGVDKLVPIGGLVVKLKMKDSLVDSPFMVKQSITGTIQMDGNPISVARAAIWTKPREADMINAHMIRGRTSAGDGYVWDTQMVKNGMFSLDVTYPSDKWYVLVETPERVVALDGPFTIAKGETKSVELVSRRCGSVDGLVSDFHSIREPLYAILFSDFGLQYEARIAIDGSFALNNIFPGKYGLKIGTDAIIDSEIPGHEKELTEEECWEWNQLPSDPWKRAFEIEVQEGEVLSGIKVEFQS